MCDGFSVCFPIGTTWSRRSVGSKTDTTLEMISFSASVRRGHIQLVVLPFLEMIGNVHGESKETSTVESDVVSIDIDCGFVVDGIKVEQDLIALPFRRHLECSPKERVQRLLGLDSGQPTL